MDVLHDTDAVSGVFERRQTPLERSRQCRRAAPGRRDHTDKVTDPQRWREKGEHDIGHFLIIANSTTGHQTTSGQDPDLASVSKRSAEAWGYGMSPASAGAAITR